jgi:predicted RND superfamily exporter protein
MSVKLEQVEILRERANVTYEEAREALEMNNGDMVEALIYLERNNKVKMDREKEAHKNSGFGTWLKNLISKGNRTKFIISKNENIIMKIPVTFLVIITIFAPYVTLFGVVVALLTEHRCRFDKEDGFNMEANKMLDKVSSAVDAAKDKLTENKTEVL